MRKKLLHGIDIAAPGGVAKLLDFHRRTFGDAVMEAGAGDGNTAGAGENNDQGNEYKAPATQADLDRIVQDRVARVHTQYAGFDDFKAKAEQADVFQSKITEHEATIGELTGKVQSFETEKDRATLVSDIAKTKNVPAEVLRGTTREELEAHADTLAALLKPTAPVIAGQERAAGNTSGNPGKEFVGKLFGND